MDRYATALWAGVLGWLCSMSAGLAAPYMIVGNDEKITWDDQGKPVIRPSGKDTVLVVDVARPEAPKVIATLQLENSIVGPPTNVAISPDNKLALIADSMTVTEENGGLKMVPTDKLFVVDLSVNPPKVSQTLSVGKQPSGLAFSPSGDLALVCNRADGTVSVLRVAAGQVTQTGTLQLGAGVSTVEFTPDGKHALAVKSPENKVAILDVTGDQVTYNKLDLPTYLFPYNVVVSPDSKLAITADNGFGGSADGNMDAVSVIDLQGPHPHVIAHVTVQDAPEGLAISPKGNLAVVANVNGSNNPPAWFFHKTGSVTILGIHGQTVTPLKTIQVGAVPEAIAFTPDGNYIYVGNYTDQDFWILKVNGTNVVDTGKRFKVPGHPASARMSAH
jgi:DNA-binding beta-propeller fold protein YncE